MSSHSFDKAERTWCSDVIDWTSALSVFSAYLPLSKKERSAGECGLCRLKTTTTTPSITATPCWLSPPTEAKEWLSKAATGKATRYCNHLHHFTKSLHAYASLLTRKYLEVHYHAENDLQDEEIVFDFLDFFEENLNVYFEGKDLKKALPCANEPLIRLLHAFLQEYQKLIIQHRFEQFRIYAHLYHYNRILWIKAKTLLLYLKNQWQTMRNRLSTIITASSNEDQQSEDRTMAYLEEVHLLISSSLQILVDMEQVWQDKEGRLYHHIHPSSALRTISPSKLNDLNNHLKNICQQSQKVASQIHVQNQCILNDLKSTFKSLFYSNKGMLMNFTLMGSRISGIGDLTSDVDVAISLYKIITKHPEHKGGMTTLGERVPIVIDNRRSVEYDIPPHMMSTSKILKAMSNKVRYKTTNKALFDVKELILFARIPLLKLIHIPTKVEIDICIENQLGVQNTLILKEVCDRDIRVKQLLTVIKHWTKQRCVNQSNMGTISTFSWCLLVVYFLQTEVSPPLIAPMNYTSSGLQQLQAFVLQNIANAKTDHPLAFSCVENEALFHFPAIGVIANDSSAAEVGSKKRSTSLAELLLHFFAFYGIDYEEKCFDFFKDRINIRATDMEKVFVEEEEIEIVVTTNAAVQDHDDDVDITDLLSEETRVVIESDDKCESLEWEAAYQKVNRQLYTKNLWRIKIQDPFEERDLAKVMSSIFTQKFLQREIRRSLVLLMSSLSTSNANPALPTSSEQVNMPHVWQQIVSAQEELPLGLFYLCNKCKQLGHEADQCIERCTRCFQRDHQVTRCALTLCKKCNKSGHHEFICVEIVVPKANEGKTAGSSKAQKKEVLTNVNNSNEVKPKDKKQKAENKEKVSNKEVIQANTTKAQKKENKGQQDELKPKQDEVNGMKNDESSTKATPPINKGSESLAAKLKKPLNTPRQKKQTNESKPPIPPTSTENHSTADLSNLLMNSLKISPTAKFQVFSVPPPVPADIEAPTADNVTTKSNQRKQNKATKKSETRTLNVNEN